MRQGLQPLGGQLQAFNHALGNQVVDGLEASMTQATVQQLKQLHVRV